MTRIACRLALFSFVFILLSENSLRADAINADVVQTAVASVASRLVRIDTIGGHEKVGDEFANEGSGTGVLLDRDGYVVTAAFLFLHDPASILLRFPDGTKKIARKIATDRNRMLTLLKVDDLDAAFLPPGSIADIIRSKASFRIGEPCLALGVALAPDEPNLTRGILSATGRIWGKAIQTDAAVGPNNYGGPLIDRDGKLLGLLAPLSMMSDDIAAGAETYDAGVGMAVPFEDILALLDRWKEGKDLEPGFVGISFKENRTFIGDALVDAVLPDSPASRGGLKAGDRISEFNGQKIDSALQVTTILKSCYAGDRLSLRFQREGRDESAEIIAETAPKKKT